MRVYRCFAFVDLSGFTALTAQEGDEPAVAVLSSFRAIVREICSRRGVRIDKWLGDGAMLVSVQPTPLLAALLEVELALDRAQLPLQVRCGAADGEVILHEGDDYIGHAVNVAARLCDLAPGGEVLITQELSRERPGWSAIREAREQEIKGFAEPLDVAVLGLARLPGSAQPCPVCGIPVDPSVAAASSRDSAGAAVWFCAESCQETWQRRPRSGLEHQGSLRVPLMGS
jgi:class 3 adenylate cyclase/YHS domain-containing protein